MAEIVTIEWSYSPTDFFEGPAEHAGKNYVAKLDQGHITAALSGYADALAVRQQIEEDLDRFFSGAQLRNRKKYQLEGYSIARTIDGVRTVEVAASGTDIFAMSDRADVAVLDASGKVISDSKAERIAADLESARRAVDLGADPTLASLFRSFKAAINEPGNELGRLYEIRDALVTKFGGGSQARASLGIGNKAWSRLGELANDLPVTQGRHGGSSVVSLRSATDEELNEGREIAQGMIVAYENYLVRSK